MEKRRVAMTAVYTPEGYVIAIVEEDVAGYAVDPREPKYKTTESAFSRVDVLNDRLGIAASEAWKIVSSSLLQALRSNCKWGPRG